MNNESLFWILPFLAVAISVIVTSWANREPKPPRKP